MADFIADTRDLKFVVFEQLDLEPLLKSSRYESFTREDLEMILDEAYSLAREVFAPANEVGDSQGCKLEGGKVSVPEAFRGPYEQIASGGWLALSNSPEYGGGGAPELMRKAVDDLFFGANIALNLGVLLTTGAAHLIETWGSDALKRIYCEKMYTGAWSGTMCLTEAGAGSDVGASKSRAKRAGDHFLIEGEKIFITFGDHDLTENVIHAVLARIEGAPVGTKGLSLFVVPKHLVTADGSLGAFNNVVCTGIEHKLGIHGSPTCTLTFGADGECRGWLLGEENQGMRAMFQMMNEARISVGMQGAALANAAYQAALVFARDRVQGAHITQLKNPDAPRVAIIEHPDVRMGLMRQKAYAEGCRALLLYSAYCIDRAAVATDEKERERFEALVEILTPICKGYASDMGFRVTEWALQTHGGYGYIKEYPAEQYLRDAKIASIYEGTNGIQAMDLVGRKLAARGGASVIALTKLLGKFIETNKEHPVLKDAVAELGRARDAWGAVNGAFMASAGKGDFLGPLLYASSYLSLCGDLLIGYMLLDQAVIAQGKLEALCKEAGIAAGDAKAVKKLAKEHAMARYLDNKVKTARFFCANELPGVQSKAQAIKTADTSAWYAVWTDE